MLDGDPNKPYYRTVKSTSSEGELSSDDEAKKGVLRKILPSPSEKSEEELRKRLMKKHANKEDDEDLLSIQPKNQERPRKSAPQDDRSSKHSADRSKHSSRDHRHKSRSPSTKKRPAIKAPSPEPKDKHSRRDRDRHHDSKSSSKHSEKERDTRKTDEKTKSTTIEKQAKTTIVEEKQAKTTIVEEKKEITLEETVQLRKVSSPSTPVFSSPSADEAAKSPAVNLTVKSLVSQNLSSNTSSPLPGMQLYSRFDSPEPESDQEDREKPIEMHISSPEGSDMEFDNKDDGTTTPIDENLLISGSKKFEDLTEEEKGLLSPTKLKEMENDYQKRLIDRLPIFYPGIYGCRSINEFKLLNRISEGTFGVVYRALEKATDEIVALKQLKMEKEKEGFPITSLREINMLMKCRKHPNIVGLREIVTDATGEKIYMSMEFVEHDLRALMKQLETRRKRFTLPQVKTLLHQLLSGVAYMHQEWVIHRDLKTANLLLSHKNILKIGDFGLAREYGDPLKPYTSLVVTLHYRCPELLLGCKTYSTAVDVWSVGCIFGEFFKLNAIYPATSENEQIKLIFEGIGTPNEKIWPGYNDLPYVSKITWPTYAPGQLRRRFIKDLQDSEIGLDLMTKLLHPCPEHRISADKALRHEWFKESPLPASPESFPTWPAKSENLKAPPERPVEQKPKPKQPDIDPARLRLLEEFNIKPTKSVASAGFSLKLGPR